MKRFIESYGLLTALVALAYWPVLSSWWFHDDWVFLANAAGIQARDNPLVRPVSYQLYWRVLWPLFGLHTWAWGLTRLGLHLGAAVMVGRLGQRAGWNRTAALLAGLWFAAAPPAFESLYWGTGAVELLWVFFAVWSVERWLQGDDRNRWLAIGLAALAVLSKEVALVLPAAFGWDLIRRGGRTAALTGALIGLLVLGLAEIGLIFADVQGTGQYGISWSLVPRVLLACGFWLVSPAPLLQDLAAVPGPGLLLGGLFWGFWGLLGYHRRQMGDARPLVLLAATLILIAPVAVLGHHAVPRYLYGPLAAFALLLMGFLRPAKLIDSPRILLLAGFVLTLLATTTVAYHRHARWPGGRPAHRLVFKQEVSWAACREVGSLGLQAPDRLCLVLGPTTDEGQERILQESLAGLLGLKLFLGKGIQVSWADRTNPPDPGAVIVRTEGVNLVAAGRTPPR